MEKDIKIGSEGDVDVTFAGGFVTLTAKYAGKQATAAANVSVSVDLLLDKLAAAIPGSVDDAVIMVAKAALKVI